VAEVSLDDLRKSAERALLRARDHLLVLQDAQGWWKGELETNVTMDAEDLLLREFLGIRTAEVTERAARWIRSQQRADGTWATYYGGPGDLSTTVEAYVALKLAGDPPDAPHMAKAAEFVLASGGIESTRVFTRIWLALFGWWSWDELPAIPPEIVLLPSWFPLNVYDFACWARQTIVALAVVAAHRPVRQSPFSLDELRSGVRIRSGQGGWALLDTFLRLYGRLAPRPLRRFAMGRAEQWILRRQEADGSWGGIQPPWVYSLMALHLQGYSLDHPAVSKGIAGIESFAIDEGGARRIEACQSPVWDTALSIVALSEAGVACEDSAMKAAAQWLVGEEVRVRGDWSVRRPRAEPGGWAFEFANDNYPDVDDTAEVILALSRFAHSEGIEGIEGALKRGRRWVEAMQSKDGGWGAFDADNVRRACTRLPFCDFGEVIDPPSADVTAHAVEMLAGELAAGRGGGETRRRMDAGVRWLLANQEPDGSWFGRWGCNYVYGTGAVVPALVAAGISREHPAVVRAVSWLESHQNPEGGWGEDIRSYLDPAWRGRGEPTASQTAWALLALVSAGLSSSPSAQRGVEWLVSTQMQDGSWDEPWFTGTGFPGDFSINYHLYRLVFPLMALGRWLSHEEVCGDV
jgi:squalene-hopene/tetraprenyl-beta-curcumene cyclase